MLSISPVTGPHLGMEWAANFKQKSSQIVCQKSKFSSQAQKFLSLLEQAKTQFNTVPNLSLDHTTPNPPLVTKKLTGKINLQP